MWPWHEWQEQQWHEFCWPVQDSATHPLHEDSPGQGQEFCWPHQNSATEPGDEDPFVRELQETHDADVTHFLQWNTFLQTSDSEDESMPAPAEDTTPETSGNDTMLAPEDSTCDESMLAPAEAYGQGTKESNDEKGAIY